MTLVDTSNHSCNTWHFIVEENMHLRNGKYVKDNRDDFAHGESQVLCAADLSKVLNAAIASTDGVLGHSLKNDVQYLSLLDVDLNVKIRYDTQTIAKRLFKEQRKLRILHEHFCSLPMRSPHNAGNDSHATGKVFLKQIERGLVRVK